jgi:hypothetical protein
MNSRVPNPRLTSSIGFAVSCSRNLLRRLFKKHAPDDARQELAERVVEHLEASGFEIDEAGAALKEEAPCAAIPDASRVAPTADGAREAEHCVGRRVRSNVVLTIQRVAESAERETPPSEGGGPASIVAFLICEPPF